MNYKTIMLQLGEQEREVEIEFTERDGDVEVCGIFDVKTKLLIADDSGMLSLIDILHDEIIRKLGLGK